MVSSEPETAHEAMLEVDVMMRAGMNEQAVKSLGALKRLCPHLENEQVFRMYYEAYDKHHAWDVAQSVVEIFADNISGARAHETTSRLLKHFVTSGWSVEDVDNWLAQKPRGRDNFWLKERLRFKVQHNLKAKELVSQLAEAVKQNPSDIPGAVDFLDILIHAPRDIHQWDVSWIGEVCKPDQALPAVELADRLKMLEAWDAAPKFYRHAIATPLTGQEVYQLMRTVQIVLSGPATRARFAVRIRESLCVCLLKFGETAEAQKLVEEAAAIRAENNLGDNTYLAGEVQAASGARVIENRVLEEEEKSGDQPQYWLDRALYHKGRSEIDHEENAYKKALSLTPSVPRPRGKVPGNMRDVVIQCYTRFLMRQKRDMDAVSLLKQELQEAPDSSSSQVAARMLTHELQEMLDPTENTYWTWLERRMKWEHVEERLLRDMLAMVEREELEPYFARAERLAEGTDPSRSKALGFIMNQMSFPRRSIPLLKYAAKEVDDENLREEVNLCLLESYLDCRDWKHAEQIFLQVANSLSAKQLSKWLAKIAVIAARMGAREDAMRIWNAVSNICPTELESIRKLVAAGLGKELKEHYQDMQMKLPESVVPLMALRIIDE
ncbi:hypothetical protein ACFL6S_01920 [Candidatus Poribacteria bacterium]